MFKKKIYFLFFVFIFIISCLKTIAQPAWTFDPFGKEKKSEKYENRKLASEKTADIKFTKKRHFLQNTITHYNYYYNSNTKINEIVDRARQTLKNDYTKLLPFYPYTLEATASQKTDLDSVIYKCTAGILLHDLRNDWIDNLYLLIGKAYFYRKTFDSATLTFQFINFNLFPRKKDEDYNRVVGTNSDAIGSNLSIANKENLNIFQKIASLPPSRNDALIWLVRSLIEQEAYGESAGLINTLSNDPNLPNRLKNNLYEVNAYWFFKQNIYDSAAVYLQKSLGSAIDKQDKARKEFLLAQLYEMDKKFDDASYYYAKAAKLTTDPLLDIYAQLNNAKMDRGDNNAKTLNKSINNLLRMAKKDKFSDYRDVIYYSAAQLALQIPDTSNSVTYFSKSIKYNQSNSKVKNQAFLQLANIAYNQKLFKSASNFYDSLKLSDTSFTNNIADIKLRRDALKKLVTVIAIIENEDSLQRIALLPEIDRNAFVKKISKKLKKDRGLKDDNDNDAAPLSFINNNTTPDLFAANNTKGDWYFYNATLKSNGLNDFNTKWGARPNVDNWRRKSALNQYTTALKNTNIPDTNNAANKSVKQIEDISFSGLMNNLPLTQQKLDSSNNIIAINLLKLAGIYQNDLEEYPDAIATYQESLKRFPTKLADGEIYLGLTYCYNKIGNAEKANYYKNLLNNNFAKSAAWQKLNTPTALDKKTIDPLATKAYDNIYNLFIEGKYDEALKQKNIADAAYGATYWTPNLLYIEALYHVKMCNDSIAIAKLNTIFTFPSATPPLKEKVKTMIDVVKRRKEIETYLTNLKVTREDDDYILIPDNNQTIKKQIINLPTTIKDTIQQPLAKAPKVVISDTIKKIPQPLSNGKFVMQPDSMHFVLMILDKVDGVYINESKNAFNRYNKQNYYGQPITIQRDTIDTQKTILIISPFANGIAALEYYDKIKKAASREVSWLPVNKYSFLIITNENLQILKQNKNIEGYKALLNKQYPGKF